MKAKLTKLIIWTAIPVLGVLAVSFLVWGIKTGTLSAWSDKLKAEIQNILTAQTTQKGVLVTAKDSSSKVVSGVLIWSYAYIEEPNISGRWEEASYLNGKTDANGKYQIEAQSPICTGTSYIRYFKFKAEKANHTSTPSESQAVAKTTFCSQLTPIDFTLSLGTPPAPGKAIIKGRVYDKSNDNSIKGAIVSVADADGVVLGKTTSDQNGNYNLSNITAGIDNTLKSSKANYDTYTVRMNISAGTVYPINIPMNPVGYQPPSPVVTIKGKIVDENNNPLVGATVGLYPYQREGILAQAKSGRDGRYEISIYKSNLVQGNYYQLLATYYLVPVSASNYYYSSQYKPYFVYQYDLMENMDIVLNLSSLRGTGIYGTVTGVKDNEMPSLFPVKITVKSESDNEQKNATNLQNGYYLLLGLEGDKDYVVRADYLSTDPANQYTSVVRTVHVGKNTRVKVDFRMNSNPNFVFPGHIEGKVVDSTGAPIQSAQIFIYDEQERNFIIDRSQHRLGGTITNQNGRYYVDFPLNEEGQISPREGSLFDFKRYTIYVRHPDYNPKNVDNPVLGDNASPLSYFNAKKTIEIHRHHGDVINVDFVIGGSKKPNPDVEKVKIVVKQIYVDWQGKQLSFWRDDSGKKHKSPEPAANAKVTLTVENLYVGRKNSGSQTSILKVTDQQGIARFEGVPKVVISVLVTKEGYITIDGQRREFNPGRLTGRDGEGYLIFEYTLKGIVAPDLARLITDPGFRDDVYQCQCWWDNWDSGLDNTIKGAGCCLTSISMALRFYLGSTDFKGRTIDPNLVSSVDGSLLSYDMISRATKGISNDTLMVEEVRGREGILNAMKNGYPVVAHFPQGRVPGHSGSSGHCVLIIGAVGNQYVYLDPNPQGGYGSLETFDLGNPDIGGFAIKPASGSAIFRIVESEQSQAIATAVNAADYSISKRIETLSVVPVSKVIYELRFADGQRDGFEATFSNMDYKATIPAFLINTGNNFTYITYALSSLGAKIELGRDRVTVDNSAVTLAKRINRLRSTLLFRLTQTKNIQDLREFLASYNQQIRQLLGIEGLPQAPLSGRVYDLNGNAVGRGVFIKVGDLITETNSDGTYSIKDTIVGDQVVIVYGDDKNRELYLRSGSKRTSVKIRQNQNNTLEIRLNEILRPDPNAANGFVQGIAYSKASRPLPFVRVRIQGGQTVTTNADGYFLLGRVMDKSQGQFNLDLPDYTDNVKQVQLYKGDLTAVNINSNVVTGNFTGTIWFNWVKSYHPSEVAKNVKVKFSNGYETMTDNNGKFYLRDFAPGFYWFEVYDPQTGKKYPNRTFPFRGAEIISGRDNFYPFAVQYD